MKLIDLKISEYLDMLLAGAFVPGEGCVSGLAGAQAAALLYRTADSLIREEAEGCDRTELENVRKEAERLYMDIAGAMEENTEESSARIMERLCQALKKRKKSAGALTGREARISGQRQPISSPLSEGVDRHPERGRSGR